MYAGCEDHLKPIDVNVWMQAMLTESHSPPPLYSREFEVQANRLISARFGFTDKDITVSNCRGIYIFLVNQFPTIPGYQRFL